MTQYCDINKTTDTVFDYDTPDKISDILINELNTIIQTIALSKLVQCKNRYNKWYNHDIETQADIKDSTNIISSYNIDQLQQYIDQYYILLTNYYGINYLKINSDKSTLLVTTRPINRPLTKDFRLTAGDYVIEQSDKIKILGLYFTNGLDNEPNI